MSCSYLRLSLGGGAGRLAIAGDLCEYVRLTQDQVVVGSDPDLGPAVLGEDDLVALRQVHRDELSVVVPGARADREDAAALRLLLRGVRKHDAALRRLLFFEDLDDEAVTKRLQVHAYPPDCFRDCFLALSPRECRGHCTVGASAVQVPTVGSLVEPDAGSGSSRPEACSCGRSAAGRSSRRSAPAARSASGRCQRVTSTQAS